MTVQKWINREKCLKWCDIGITLQHIYYMQSIKKSVSSTDNHPLTLYSAESAILAFNSELSTCFFPFSACYAWWHKFFQALKSEFIFPITLAKAYLIPKAQYKTARIAEFSWSNRESVSRNFTTKLSAFTV